MNKSKDTPASDGADYGGKTKLRYYLEQGGQLALALLIVFAIRSSFFEPFKIPSGSMIPTLYIGDFIFVNKFAYGFKVPFSEYFGDAVTMIERAPPKHGDVIVFLYPENKSVHYIKRVIGLPGDKVEVKNKVVYINDKPYNQAEVDNEFKSKKLKDIAEDRYGESHMRMFRETVDSREHLMMIDSQNEYTANFPARVVPPDHLFVMGDNRDFSNDSRFWGFVPFENVSGRAEVIWLSLWVNLKEFGKSTFKPGRIGTILN